MTKIQDIDEMYVCDACGYTFIGKDVELQNPIENMEIWGGFVNLFCVDKDNTIICTAPDKVKEGDRYLACPKCHAVHLCGFNVSTRKEVKEDETRQ